MKLPKIIFVKGDSIRKENSTFSMCVGVGLVQKWWNLFFWATPTSEVDSLGSKYRCCKENAASSLNAHTAKTT